LKYKTYTSKLLIKVDLVGNELTYISKYVVLILAGDIRTLFAGDICNYLFKRFLSFEVYYDLSESPYPTYLNFILYKKKYTSKLAIW